MRKGGNKLKTYDIEAVEYIAKLAEGGLRDSITMLDKCLAYSSDLTISNVVKALGTTNYDTMFKLTDCLLEAKHLDAIQIIEQIHAEGKDLKQFIHQYTNFLLDINKYGVGCPFELLQLPKLKEYVKWLEDCGEYEFNYCLHLLKVFVSLNSSIKYSQYVKADIEACIMLLEEANKDA